MKTNKKRFNKGTKYGKGILKKSLQQFGCTKSILVDKDNTIICGNDVYNIAQELGYKTRVIETTGDELIVIKRTDLDAQSQKGMEVALVDNLCQTKNLKWDIDTILDVMQDFFGFDPRSWGMDVSLEKELNIEDFFSEAENQKVKPKTESEFTHVDQPSLFDTF